MSAPAFAKQNPMIGLCAAIGIHGLLVLLVLMKLQAPIKPIPIEPATVLLIKEIPPAEVEFKPVIAQPIAVKPVVVPHLPPPDIKVDARPVNDLPRLPERANAITAAMAAPPTPTEESRPLDYESRLMAHLNGLKRYPIEARRVGHSGTVTVRFRIDRQGHVLSYRFEQGSGHATLDEETRRLMQRADPFPAPPEAMTGSDFEFVVPIQYKLG